MKTGRSFGVLVLGVVFVLSGCVVRTYQSTKDRLDQDLSGGNRGYLKGQAPYSEPKPKKASRSTQVVEVELHPPIKFEKMKHPKETNKAVIEKTGQDTELWGNRGYMTQSESPVMAESAQTSSQGFLMQEYKVQKGDTLQKIAQKHYGTTKKWTKIYDANKDVLKGPDKIYPGQTINIPIESQPEIKDNLK